MTAEREAPMPPVFMHSSTMIHLRVFLTLLVMASRSKGFKLIKSMTYIQNIAESRAKKLCLFDVQMLRQWGKSAIEQQAFNSEAHHASKAFCSVLLHTHFSQRN